MTRKIALIISDVPPSNFEGAEDEDIYEEKKNREQMLDTYAPPEMEDRPLTDRPPMMVPDEDTVIRTKEKETALTPVIEELGTYISVALTYLNELREQGVDVTPAIIFKDKTLIDYADFISEKISQFTEEDTKLRLSPDSIRYWMKFYQSRHPELKRQISLSRLPFDLITAIKSLLVIRYSDLLSKIGIGESQGNEQLQHLYKAIEDRNQFAWPGEQPPVKEPVA